VKRFFLYLLLAISITNKSSAAQYTISNTVELQWAVCNQTPLEVSTQLLQHNIGQKSELSQLKLSYLDTRKYLLYSKDIQIKIENGGGGYKVSVKVNNLRYSSPEEFFSSSDPIIVKKQKCEWDVYPGENGTQKYACKLNNTISNLNGGYFSQEQVDFILSETGINLMELKLQPVNWFNYEDLTLNITLKNELKHEIKLEPTQVTEPLSIDSIILNDGTPITEVSLRTTTTEKEVKIAQMNKILLNANISLCPIQLGKLDRIISK
jgi:hypothetical protein